MRCEDEVTQTGQRGRIAHVDIVDIDMLVLLHCFLCSFIYGLWTYITCYLNELDELRRCGQLTAAASV